MDVIFVYVFNYLKSLIFLLESICGYFWDVYKFLKLDGG